MKTVNLATTGQAGLAKFMDKLRENDVPEDKIADVFAAVSDMSLTNGNTIEEYEELRKRVPQDGAFKLMDWTVFHSRIDI